MEPENYLDYDLSILDPYLRDEATVEIAVNPDGHVWIERAGDAVMTRADLTLTVDQAHDLAGVIANTQDLTLTEQQPAISTTIEYRGVTLRCQAIVRPAAAIGPTLSFRIFRRRPGGVEPRRFAFLRDQSVSLEQERHDKLAHIQKLALTSPDPDDFLRECVREKMNILISGGTSAGKTELGRRLLWMVTEWERLVLIEDSSELLPAKPNVVGLLADRIRDSERSADKLLEMTLRLRPDRIILGELRGAEALTFLEAINTGHEGSFTTVHATTARKAVNRLAFLVLRAGMPLTMTEISRYISDSIDVIIQTGRIGKQRGILETYFPALEDDLANDQHKGH
ncbi:ATPase, T2SS/T4P/T4SS family [Paracoccus albus]|uniref:ATPase, T2SS/T4P/T4SS family n=1 Tax=Paracoccus albus TaxID=3017784 RepID=UPI0022F075C3|nr:ATPase, T2SS/T4P/T4SS family [Paracoccus albus]WBU62210.1 ATPase, T2SS/T4P/T4SS family [Paracoccus albus]